MTTNVTILCANRPRLLKQTLDSIGDLSDATVVIRDAGMNSAVSQIASDWMHTPVHGHYIRDRKPTGTGTARNQVIKASEEVYGRGRYLYLSDDDVCFRTSHWLSILTHVYDAAWEDGYRVIGAYNHPYHLPIGPATKINEWQVFPIYALALQSMLMRWSVWDEYGPFCDTPPGKVCQSEDAAFCNKIRDDGFKVGVIAPALLVNTGITNSFGEHIPGWEMVKKQAPEGVVVE